MYICLGRSIIYFIIVNSSEEFNFIIDLRDKSICRPMAYGHNQIIFLNKIMHPVDINTGIV